MKGPLADLPDELAEQLKSAKHPEWLTPMLATLTDKRFSDPDWIFERKFDGERALGFKKCDSVRLLTRNKKTIVNTYPEIVAALARQAANDFVVDGEIVAFDGHVTSFSRLQKRMQITDPDKARQSPVSVYYYLFDVLHLNGHDTGEIPLRSRKRLLQKAISFSDPLRLTPHRNATGEAFFKQACKEGWEGLIAKRADAEYSHSRSSNWLKFKCIKGQELVIGGFTEPLGSRIGLGALLVGYFEQGLLHYAGKVGTGFDNEIFETLRKKLGSLKRPDSPFCDEVRAKEVTWVEPNLVGECRFTEWTKNGKLRHPSFVGLRDDKPAHEVVREMPTEMLS